MFEYNPSAELTRGRCACAHRMMHFCTREARLFPPRAADRSGDSAAVANCDISAGVSEPTAVVIILVVGDQSSANC